MILGTGDEGRGGVAWEDGWGREILLAVGWLGEVRWSGVAYSRFNLLPFYKIHKTYLRNFSSITSHFRMRSIEICVVGTRRGGG